MINSIEGIIPKNIYLNNQNIISNKRLTNREIDVIACLVGGRSNKKAASFLGISPKTIENHIHNIMLKLGCASRESIIDFLEKSEEFSSLKEHYLSILIKVIFESELKKISGSIKKKDLNCLNIYYNIQQEKPSFMLLIEKHLEIAGFKICSKLWKKDQMNVCLSNSPGSQPTNYVIYNISADFLEQLKNIDCTLSLEKILNNIAAKSPATTIFLLLEPIDHPPFTSIQNNLYRFINVTEQENYYFLIFEILKRILLENNIVQNIEEFKKQYQILFVPTSLQKQITENKLLERTSTTNSVKNYNKRWVTLAGITGSLLVFYIMFGILDVKKEMQFMKNKLQKIIVYPGNIIEKPSKLAKLAEKQMLLNLPPRNNKFTGRESYLIRIKDQLNNKKFGIITQAISGLGGIGKTQLATEFAYRSAEEANYAAILWVAAETSNVMHNSYKKFADHLQINTENLNINEIQKLIHNNLTEKYKGSKILFILDNVEQNKDIKNYLASLYEQSAASFTPHILITSRSQDWVESPLILETFSQKEALVFIKNQLPNEQEASIINLSKILNYFPLALSQAVAYIKTHSNIDDYLEAYAMKKEDYLNEVPNNNDHYVESLWRTWNITLSKLSKNGQNLLFTSAYLEPDDIPIELFSNLTVVERMKAIEDLRKHSLITLINNNKSFKIHRLLQEVIRLTDKTGFKRLLGTDWLSNAINLLENKFDFNYLDFKKWNLHGRYLNHAKTAAEHATNTPSKLFDRGIKLYAKTAMFMTHIMIIDNRELVDIWLKLLQLTKKYKHDQDNSLLTASINTHLGVVKRLNGKMDDAKIYIEKAVAVYLQAHITTITKQEKELINILRLIPLNKNVKLSDEVSYDLGYALTQLGNILYSSDLISGMLNYNKALTIFSKLEGSAIKKFVTYQKVDTLYNLGGANLYLGNLILAENLLNTSKVLADQIYVNHQQQAFTYSKLAQFYSHIGRFEESDQLFKDAFSIASVFLSNKHYIINSMKTRMACNAYMLGNNKVAKLLLEEADFYFDTSNNNYWRWFSKIHLARIYEFIGEYDKALHFTKESIIITKKYHKLHDFLAFQLTRAELWTKRKEVNTTFWKKMLALTIQLFGENHYQTARYHQLYGQALTNTQQYKKAMAQYKKAMAILKAEKIKHPDLVRFQQQNLQILQELIKESL